MLCQGFGLILVKGLKEGIGESALDDAETHRVLVRDCRCAPAPFPTRRRQAVEIEKEWRSSSGTTVRSPPAWQRLREQPVN